MKTQQAHSLGGTRFRASIDTRKHVPPLVWLSLVCLDAPLVALAWLWLFARTFQVPLQAGNGVALFLTAWLIYLADRFADAATLKPNVPRSQRQEFCFRHPEIWIATLTLVAGFDAYVVWRTTAPETFFIGAIVGVLALVYLVVNHPLGLIWRSLPAKEIAVGCLFATGTAVALSPRLSTTTPFVVAIISFAALCSLNCISIARWERELDSAQGKVSIATRHPGITRYAGAVCALLAVVALSVIIALPGAGAILGCIAGSALLLAWLNVSARSLGIDQRTALADLVLLTPIVLLVASAL